MNCRKIALLLGTLFFAVVSAAVFSPLVYAEPKPKFKICLNSSTGAMIAKSKCSKAEAPLNLNTILSSVATVKGEAGATGPKGDTGATGPTGPKGDPGVKGVLGLGSPLPSGLTIFGYMEIDTHAVSANNDFRAPASLPAPAPVVFSDSNVIVVNNSSVATGCGGSSCLHSADLTLSLLCSGTSQNPSAPPGFVCIYPSGRINLSSIHGLSDNQFGFFVSGNSVSSGDVLFRATWAYTVP